MIEDIIKKYNLNVISMIRNGTVALITMIGVGILFGVKNIMIAFPIALTSTVIGRQNFYIKPFNKIRKILIIDLLIVVVSFLSSLNIWSGIFIDLIAIFLIIYLVSSPYDVTFYKPFIMLYIFMQYAKITIYELPNRLLSVVFGIVVIIGGTYIKRGNANSILGTGINFALKTIKIQLENILKNNFNSSITKNCSKTMMDLVYKVYTTRHKKYLINDFVAMQLKIYLDIEYINISLSKVFYEYKDNKITKNQIINLLVLIEAIINYSLDDETIEDVIYRSNSIKKNEGDSQLYKEIIFAITSIVDFIKDLENLNSKAINNMYKNCEKNHLDKQKIIFKEYFILKSIKFKFAMRMATTLSFSIFMGELLGFYKIIWAIITVMSIMQPYYEDTILKSKERVKGNIIAILLTGIIVHLFNSKIITILILIISLYLLYAFKEYYKISLFAAIASICVSSLSVNINKLIFYRILYVIVGVGIVLLANKFIFPYKLKNGVEDLINKILRYDKYLIEHSKNYLNKNKEEDYIKNLIVHITLLTQKLYIRNLQYGDENVEKFIYINNEFVVKVGYNVLLFYLPKYNENYFKDIYQDFIKKVNNLVKCEKYLL